MGSGICRSVDIRLNEITNSEWRNDKKLLERRTRKKQVSPLFAKSNKKPSLSESLHLNHTQSKVNIAVASNKRVNKFSEELNCSLCSLTDSQSIREYNDNTNDKQNENANQSAKDGTPVAWMEDCIDDHSDDRIDDRIDEDDRSVKLMLSTIIEEKRNNYETTNDDSYQRLCQIEVNALTANETIVCDENSDIFGSVLECHLEDNDSALSARSITPIAYRSKRAIHSECVSPTNESYDFNAYDSDNPHNYIRNFSANLTVNSSLKLNSNCKQGSADCGLCEFVVNGCHSTCDGQHDGQDGQHDSRWHELDMDVTKLMDTVDKLGSLLAEKELSRLMPSASRDAAHDNNEDESHLKENVIHLRNKKRIGVSLQRTSCGRRLIMFKDGHNTYQIEVSNPSEIKSKHEDLNDINNTAQSPEVLSKNFEKNVLYEAFDSKKYSINQQIGKTELRLDTFPQSVDTLEVCDKAAVRLRELAHHIEHGEVPNSVLQKTLQYAAYVLDTVSMDEKRKRPVSLDKKTGPIRAPSEPSPNVRTRSSTHEKPVENESPKTTPIKTINSSKQWTRRLLDEEDELSEVQPDAVPTEVREWLASTFTKSNASQKRRPEDKPKFRSVANAIRAGIMVDRIYRRLANSAALHIPSEIAIHLKSADEWCFDVFSLNDVCNGQVLKFLSADLLNRYGLIHKFKIPSSNLENFLIHIEQGYVKYSNPYHNNLHAADVTQTVHYSLWSAGLAQWLSDLEIFATLIAAIIHDFQHTGTTNNFHVMSSSDITLIYNDRAVLENFHISAAFKVLRDDNSNILINLSKEEYREFRTLVIDMVLATDMSSHFQQIKTLKTLLAHTEFNLDKSKVLSYILHCSDISHPSKNFKLHHKWTQLLMEEFFRQGDMEKELGLPYSPLCDRNTTLVPQSQIGFIDFIVGPTMEVCGDLIDKILFHIHGSQPEISDKNKQELSDQKSRTKSLSSMRTFQRNNMSLDSGTETSNVRSASSAPIGQRLSLAKKVNKIKRPWLGYLEDNKINWQDKAASDSMIKSDQKMKGSAETAVTTPESEL